MESKRHPGITNKNKHLIKQVMVIDDDQFTLDLYGAILSKHQIDHRLFDSAKSFITDGSQHITSGTTLLIDYRLSCGITGAQLAEQLKATVNEEVLFIAVTEQIAQVEVLDILKTQFDDFLFKPFTEEKLIKLLSSNTREAKNSRIIGSPHSVVELNLKNLIKLADNDPSLIESFILDFIEETKVDLTHLKNAAIKKQTLKCINILHRIGGRCGHLGAHELAQACKNLETLLLKQDNCIDGVLTNEIDTVISRTKKLISKLIDKDMMSP